MRIFRGINDQYLHRLGDLFILVCGIISGCMAYSYGIGTLRTSGAGLFPFISSTMLVLSSGLLLIKHKAGEGAAGEVVKPTVIASGFILSFFCLLPSLGLALTILAALLWVRWFDRRLSVRHVMIILSGLTLFSYIVFDRMLSLTLGLVPPFLRF